MAEIYLFHSALGLRPGVVEAAERLRRAGHYVHAPYAQAVWVPGAWVFVRGQYVWHPGHWRR